MKFVLPAIFFLFSGALVSVWLVDRERRYMAFCGAGFAFIGAAVLMQAAFIPTNYGANIILSGSFYVSGAMLMGYGMLRRSALSLPLTFYAGVWSVIVGVIAYNYYIEESLINRVYILNLGLGVMFLVVAWRLRVLWHGQIWDRVLLVVAVFLAVHFFPRTLLTTQALVHVNDPKTFTNSVFWNLSMFSTAIIGASLGLILLVATGADMALGLRRERDTDTLTGLLNRRGLLSQFAMLRHAQPTVAGSVIVCDLDYFKNVNDTYGHHTGDIALEQFASVIRTFLEPHDLAARTGGEEFVLFLRDVSVEKAFITAESLCLKTRDTAFGTTLPELKLTCSCGVARLEAGEDLWAAVDRADKQLYSAKQAGRNRTFAEGVYFSSVVTPLHKADNTAVKIRKIV